MPYFYDLAQFGPMGWTAEIYGLSGVTVACVVPVADVDVCDKRARECIRVLERQA